MAVYFLSGILIFLNFVYTFGKKHKKFVAFILMLFAWILFWGNTMNPDYENYVRNYLTIKYSAGVFAGNNTQIGFAVLVKLATLIGLSYEWFLAVVVLWAYLLIHSTVSKFSNNYNYIYLLYFIFPFFLDVVQIKNFLAMAIFIYAIKYLLDESIKSKIKYCLLIVVSGTIHYAALLYLPMVLINVKKKNKLTRAIVSFAIIGSLFILLNGKKIPFINDFVTIMFNSEKILNWVDSKTRFGFILFWLLQTISFLMAKYSRKIFIRNTSEVTLSNETLTKKNCKDVNEKGLMFVNLIYWINIMAFLYFPLYILASTFTRLMRNIIFLNYISFSITNQVIRRRNEKTLFNIIIGVYVLVFFLVQMVPYIDTIIKTVLNNNLIFK